MAYTDWGALSDNASGSSIAVGAVTSAVVPPPNGGGSFVAAAHSLISAAGVAAFYSTLTNFTPTSKGGVVSAAIRKGGAGGAACSAFVFICLNGQASTNIGYLLGLSDGDTSRLVLRKGQLAAGLPDVAPGSQGVLRRSTTTFARDTWVHIKLEAIKQPNGDVTLNVYQSDLLAHAVSSPAWVAVPGMASFTDDALQVNTGSAPLTSGRMGFGMTSAEINRIAAWDQIVTERQLLP